MPNCEKGRGGKWRKVGEESLEKDREDERKRKSEIECIEKFVYVKGKEGEVKEN